MHRIADGARKRHSYDMLASVELATDTQLIVLLLYIGGRPPINGDGCNGKTFGVKHDVVSRRSAFDGDDSAESTLFTFESQ